MSAVKNINLKQELLSSISRLNGLTQVEDLIRSKLVSDARLLVQIPNYLLDLGGKRMRPVLCLLVANSLGMETPTKPLIQIAAGIELIHMATLLHDDIIDNSTMRRHKDSALKMFGMPSTLLAGDFLLTRAFALCAHLDGYIIDASEQACIELTEGEILETPLFTEVHTLDSYLIIAQKKTASLFRLAAESAAHICKLVQPEIKQIAKFGENLGIAFQILDDILDVTADEDLLGKKSGSDLKEKKPSIINILWLNSDSKLAKEFFSTSDPCSEEQLQAAIMELRSGCIIDQARSIASQYADKAKSALDSLLLCSKIDKASLADLNKLIDYTILRAG